MFLAMLGFNLLRTFAVSCNVSARIIGTIFDDSADVLAIHLSKLVCTSGEGCASLCLKWECGFGSAMDCCKFCTPRGLAAPYHTGSLQWQLRVTGAGMAGDDSGIGSGWQQSKQN